MDEGRTEDCWCDGDPEGVGGNCQERGERGQGRETENYHPLFVEKLGRPNHSIHSTGSKPNIDPYANLRRFGQTFAGN